MGFGLLFVPLLGGYLFLTWCRLTRYIVRRQSGHHLLFWSASVGMALLACAQVVALLLSDVIQSWPNVVELWQRVAPFPYVGTTALAFLLGPFWALVINLFHSPSSGAMRAVHRAGNSLELLFIEAMKEVSTVELSLQSGKVYVGWILKTKIAGPARAYVEMLPLASGFRTQETHELKFTTDYAQVLDDEAVIKHDFRVVIPVTEIQSARPFDLETYYQF